MMSLPFPPNEIQILLHKATTVLFLSSHSEKLVRFWSAFKVS